MGDAKRFLGLDTGQKNIGWAVIELDPKGEPHLVDAGNKEPKEKDLGERLYQLSKWAQVMAVKYGMLEAVGYEEVFFSYRRKDGTKGTASKHKQLVAYHTGAILGILGVANAKGYRPQEVKLHVAGYGRAGKDQVARAVAIRLGLDQSEKYPDHVTDAMAIALCRALEWQWSQRLQKGGAVR